MTESELTERIFAICEGHGPINIKAYLRHVDKIVPRGKEFNKLYDGALKTLNYHDLIIEHPPHIGGDDYIELSPTGHQVFKKHKTVAAFEEFIEQPVFEVGPHVIGDGNIVQSILRDSPTTTNVNNPPTPHPIKKKARWLRLMERLWAVWLVALGIGLTILAQWLGWLK